MCIRRAAADRFSGGCGADDADHRIARQTQCIEEHDVIFRHRHKVDASGRETRSRYTRAGQGRQHRALVQLDAVDMHAQGVARLGAFDVKRLVDGLMRYQSSCSKVSPDC